MALTHKIRAGLAGIVLTSVAFFTSAAPAHASGLYCPPGSGSGEGKCFIIADSAGSSGSGGGGLSASGASTMTCSYRGEQVACSDPKKGSWDQTRGCYIRTAQEPTNSTQATQFDHLLEAHKDEGGVILGCYRPMPTGSVGDYLVGGYTWAPAPPPAGPSPAELAERAISQMDFAAPTIGSNPPQSSDPKVMGLVGYPVGLWVANPGESTTGPMTRSATAGAMTVTATATLVEVHFTMGDGSTERCTNVTTPWNGRPASETPPCGHTYTHTSAGQPNEQYPVSATAYWTIHWSGGGQSGEQWRSFTSSTALRIGEAHVLIVKSGNS